MFLLLACFPDLPPKPDADTSIEADADTDADTDTDTDADAEWGATGGYLGLNDDQDAVVDDVRAWH